MQGAVGFGNVEAETDFAEMSRACAVRNAVKFQGAEFRLRIRQNVFDRGKLQQIAGIARTEAQALAAIDYRAAKTKSDRGNAISESHRRYRIKIVGAYHARKIRIEAWAVNRAHNLLEHDRHLFLFQAIGSGAHVSLCMLAES